MVQRVEARARPGASPQEVFDVLADVTCWSRWGRWSRAELERPDEAGGGGVGAVRVLESRSYGRTVVNRELVTELVPGETLGYHLLSGLPLRDYHGRVELRPDGDGTLVTWSCRFERATPGLTRLYRRALQGVLSDAVERLARYAERDHATA